MSAARKQAPRLARPAARYWKGKAPKGVTDVSSDSDEEEAPDVEEDGDVLISGDQDIVEEANENVPVQKHAKAMNVSLKDVSISKDGKVTVAGRGESGRTAMEEDGKQLASSILFEAQQTNFKTDQEDDSEDDEIHRTSGHPAQEADSDDVNIF